MQSVCFIGLPQCLASSIGLPLEMLNAADSLARSKSRHTKALSIKIASEDGLPFKTAGGLTLQADCSFEAIEHCDLIIVPALWRNPLKTIQQHRALIEWLKKMAAQNALICAVGTGSCYLAEANLLNNKPATTHWYFCDQFKKHYPNVNLKQRYLITQAGKLYCAGSVSSVADLTVHLIEKNYGTSIAQKVENQFSPEIRRAFSSHAFAEYESNPHQDEVIIQAQEWLQRHVSDDIQLKQLAEQLGLTMRTFNRRFKQATTITASQYLINLRINIAKDLLRDSNLSVAEIAEKIGYQDSSYFCLRFKKITSQTPLLYRRSARGKLFKVNK